MELIAELEPAGGSRIGSWGGSMTCKSNGTFEVKGVPPGEYVVTVKPNPMKEGDATDTKTVKVEAGRTIDLEFVLKPGTK